MATSMENGVFGDVTQNCEKLKNDLGIFYRQNPAKLEDVKNIYEDFHDRFDSFQKSKAFERFYPRVYDGLQSRQKSVHQNIMKYINIIKYRLLPTLPNDDFFRIDNKKNGAVSLDTEDVASSDKEMEQDDAEYLEYDSSEETQKDIPVSDEDKHGTHVSELDNKRKKKDKSLKHKSIVDDKVLKLSKLQMFYILGDLKELKVRDNDGDTSDDEKDVNLFPNFSDEDSEDESDKKLSKDYMSADFSDGPESGDENIKHSDSSSDLEDEDLDSEDANIPSEEDSSGDDEEESATEHETFNIKRKDVKERIRVYRSSRSDSNIPSKEDSSGDDDEESDSEYEIFNIEHEYVKERIRVYLSKCPKPKYSSKRGWEWKKSATKNKLEFIPFDIKQPGVNKIRRIYCSRNLVTQIFLQQRNAV